jgi:hypothetical protein
VRWKTRRGGAGSLGRQRFVALADWNGGLVAREAKAILPSAYVLAGQTNSQKTWISEIVEAAVRIPDPFFHTQNGWIIRRLSPHCSRIELSSLPATSDEERLLHAMGSETANIHLGSRRAVRSILRDIATRSVRELHVTVKDLVSVVIRDWGTWRKK